MPTVPPVQLSHKNLSKEEYDKATCNESVVSYETDATMMQNVFANGDDEDGDQQTETAPVTDGIADLYLDIADLQAGNVSLGRRDGDWYQQNVDQVVASMRKLMANDSETDVKSCTRDDERYSKHNTRLAELTGRAF
jgi:hypothetical protein